MDEAGRLARLAHALCHRDGLSSGAAQRVLGESYGIRPASASWMTTWPDTGAPTALRPRIRCPSPGSSHPPRPTPGLAS